MCFSSKYFRRGLTTCRQKQTADDLLLIASSFFFSPSLCVHPLPALIAHSLRLPRYFSDCLHLPSLTTRFSLPSFIPYHTLPSNTVLLSFFSPLLSFCIFSHLPVFSSHSFTPVSHHLCLTLPFSYFSSLHSVVLCLPACLPVCLFHKGAI